MNSLRSGFNSATLELRKPKDSFTLIVSLPLYFAVVSTVLCFPEDYTFQFAGRHWPLPQLGGSVWSDRLLKINPGVAWYARWE